MAIGKTFIQILGPNEQFPNNPGFPTIFLQKQVDPTRTVFGFNDGNGNTFSSMLILERGSAPGTKLSRIFDVNAPNPSSGDTLVYNSTTEKWVNGTISVTGGTSGNLWSGGAGSNSIIANNSTGNGANGQYSVAFGNANQILQTANSAFLGGGSGNIISGGTNDYSSIVGGLQNRIVSSSGISCSIFAGNNNLVSGSTGINNSSIIGGSQNKLINSSNSVIVGGQFNTLSGDGTSNNCAIIGGSGNTITDGVSRSVILGGTNMRALSSDTVYTPNLVINNNLSIASGTNASAGMVTLTAGAATVNNTSVLTSSIIMLSIQSLGTVSSAKSLAITSRVVGSSFTITSSDATDTSVVAWQIIQQV